MMPSDASTPAITLCQLRRRVAGHEVVSDIHREVPQFHYFDVDGVSGRGELAFRGGGQLVRQQAARRRDAESGGKNGDTAGFHGVLLV